MSSIHAKQPISWSRIVLGLPSDVPSTQQPLQETLKTWADKASARLEDIVGGLSLAKHLKGAPPAPMTQIPPDLWLKMGRNSHHSDFSHTERLLKKIEALVRDDMKAPLRTGTRQFPSRLLEVCAGDGTLSLLVEDRVGCPVIATDLHAGEGVMGQDVRTLPDFPDGSMGMVISSNGYEFTGDLGAIARVLRPGGHLVASVHHAQSDLGRLSARLVKVSERSHPAKLRNDRVLREFFVDPLPIHRLISTVYPSETHLRKHLAESGFHDVQIESVSATSRELPGLGNFAKALSTTLPPVVKIGWIFSATRQG